MSLTIAIHQPNYLPWAGFLNKLMTADIFVILTSVQFSDSEYQHRTKIGPEAVWTSLSVKKKLGTPIRDINVIDTGRSARQIENAYRNAPYYNEHIRPFVERLAATTNPPLAQLNSSLLLMLQKMLGISTPTVTYSHDRFTPDPDRPVSIQRLEHICKQFGATQYITGSGGKNYMDELTGIETWFQNIYPSTYPGSILHLLAYHPKTEVKQAIRNCAFYDC